MTCDEHHTVGMTFRPTLGGMSTQTHPADLKTMLQEGGERIRKPRYSVLFRCGEKSFGMFVVLSGKVSLDVGIVSPFARAYEAGALLGLPATVSRREYSMTATVTEDAELAFWTAEALESLLRDNPTLCHELLGIMAERLAENHELMKALLRRRKPPSQKSSVA
jgi:CRP-like cAMP-binding protein